jgi:hypothetical protein
MILWHPLNKFPYVELGTGKVVRERHFFPNLINECCEGCQRVSHGHCTAYVDTITIWSARNCPLATHVKHGVTEQKQKVNPLKASKKSKKGVR